MARNSVRGTPYTHIGPAGSNEGYRQGGGNASNTVQPQFREGGINTEHTSRGTPAQYQHGNAADAKRVASHDKYGHVLTGPAGNMNDPASNGNGVILDGVASDYEDPKHEATLDSPVPRSAPVFETRTVEEENRAHLGKGSHPAGARDEILALDGVMSRGMLGTSKPSQPETALTNDDTLPATAPAGKV